MNELKLLKELSEIASSQLIYFKEENKRLKEENERLLGIIENLSRHERKPI